MHQTTSRISCHCCCISATKIHVFYVVQAHAITLHMMMTRRFYSCFRSAGRFFLAFALREPLAKTLGSRDHGALKNRKLPATPQSEEHALAWHACMHWVIISCSRLHSAGARPGHHRPIHHRRAVATPTLSCAKEPTHTALMAW